MTVSQRTINKFDGNYRFLSNFYQSAIEIEGIRYETVEAAYQAAKAVNREDKEKIAKLETPGQAKKMGRTVSIREDWEEIKCSIMFDLLTMKFQDSYLRSLLLATGDAYLEEGNSWGDTFWGVSRGVGKNILGYLIMQIRDVIWEDIMAGPLTRLNYIYNPSLHYWDNEGKLRWIHLNTLVPLSKNKYNSDLKLQAAAAVKAKAKEEASKAIDKLASNDNE